MKLFFSILLVALLIDLPCSGEVYSVIQPGQKSKNIFGVKNTAADQIEYYYGIIAGQNITTIKTNSSSQDVITGWMAGLAMQVVWPQGFAVQPEILYSQKGCISDDPRIQYDMDYIEVPVKIKYRLYLADIKPFAFVSPYVAYAIKVKPQEDSIYADPDQLNKFDAGIGAGAGFDIWNVQLSFKYSWGFAQVLNEVTPLRNKVFTISLGFLF